jgi:hypothetical protein
MSKRDPKEFDPAEITHAAVFTLRHGSKFAIARTPDGVFLAATSDTSENRIAFSNEAADILISALLSSRADRFAPLPHVELFPYEHPDNQENT